MRLGQPNFLFVTNNSNIWQFSDHDCYSCCIAQAWWKIELDWLLQQAVLNSNQVGRYKNRRVSRETSISFTLFNRERKTLKFCAEYSELIWMGSSKEILNWSSDMYIHRHRCLPKKPKRLSLRNHSSCNGSHAIQRFTCSYRDAYIGITDCLLSHSLSEYIRKWLQNLMT